MKPKALFKVANHSNRGREWENELSAVHDWYRMQRKADVVKNPHEWSFASPRDYQNALPRLDPGMLAITSNGRHMIRSRSDVDFSGGGDGFSICFDAKASEANRFPLSNLKDHQVRRLVDSSRCGVRAGFMVKMCAQSRVFFVPAAFMESRHTQWLIGQARSTKGRRGQASLSIEDLTKHGVEIFQNKVNGLWDWLPAVIGGRK